LSPPQSFKGWADRKVAQERKKTDAEADARRRKGILTGREIFAEVRRRCQGCP